jgi:N-acetyl-gamma-glutamyl-phosphate reductase
MTTVGIIGASGYTGAELLRLAAPPRLRGGVATGDSMAGTAAAALYPSLQRPIRTSCSPSSIDDRRRRLDLVFLGLPHAASRWRSRRRSSTASAASWTCRRRTD